MTDRQLISTLGKVGFRGKALRLAFGIAKRESRGDPHAYNPDRSTGDDSYGLFQINMLGDLGPSRRKQFGLASNDDLYDPMVNARAAFKMSKGGKDFGAWGLGPNAYRSGAGYDTIKQYVEAAPVGPPARTEAAVVKPFKLPDFDVSSILDSRSKDLGSSGFSFDPVPFGRAEHPNAGTPSLIDPLPPELAEAKARKYGGTIIDKGPAAAPNDKVARAIQIAKAQLGKPYVFGATNPKVGFDCSGLIEYAFEQAGISTPGRLTTRPMSTMGKQVSWQGIQPGDWIVRNSGDEGHVVMYVGNGQVIAAPHTGEVVQLQPLSRFSSDPRFHVRRWHG